MTGGIKYDNEKNRLDLICPEVILEMGRYMNWDRFFAADAYRKTLEHALEWRYKKTFGELQNALCQLHFLYVADEELDGIQYANETSIAAIVPEFIELIGKVLTFGSKKYDDNNWMRLDNLQNRYYGAFMRHMMAWRKGENNDPETGLSHLGHAACCLHFILWKELQEVNK